MDISCILTYSHVCPTWPYTKQKEPFRDTTYELLPFTWLVKDKKDSVLILQQLVVSAVRSIAHLNVANIVPERIPLILDTTQASLLFAF